MATYRKNNDSDQSAGELRHRITFLIKQVTMNGGIAKETWVHAFTCWAAVEPLRGREYYQAAAINRENEVRFTIRYRKYVSETMRLRFQDMEYSITAMADPFMRHIKLEIMAKSVMPIGK